MDCALCVKLFYSWYQRTKNHQSNANIVDVVNDIMSFSEVIDTMSEKTKYKIKVSSGSAIDILTDLDVSQAATQRAGRYITIARQSLGMKEVAGTHVLIRVPSGKLKITSKSEPTIIRKAASAGKATKKRKRIKTSKTAVDKVAKKSSSTQTRKKKTKAASKKYRNIKSGSSNRKRRR